MLLLFQTNFLSYIRFLYLKERASNTCASYCASVISLYSFPFPFVLRMSPLLTCFSPCLPSPTHTNQYVRSSCLLQSLCNIESDVLDLFCVLHYFFLPPCMPYSCHSSRPLRLQIIPVPLILFSLDFDHL